MSCKTRSQRDVNSCLQKCEGTFDWEHSPLLMWTKQSKIVASGLLTQMHQTDRLCLSASSNVYSGGLNRGH
ncbi:hypothetical protein BsWGS_25032 [Bradybaena similaris]